MRAALAIALVFSCVAGSACGRTPTRQELVGTWTTVSTSTAGAKSTYRMTLEQDGRCTTQLVSMIDDAGKTMARGQPVSGNWTLAGNVLSLRTGEGKLDDVCRARVADGHLYLRCQSRTSEARWDRE